MEDDFHTANSTVLSPFYFVANNTAVEGCNGEAASFEVGEGIWNSTFIGNDGDEYDIDVFYATYDDQLWVRTLQVNEVDAHVLRTKLVVCAESEAYTEKNLSKTRYQAPQFVTASATRSNPG